MQKTHLLATMFCPRFGDESIILGLHGLNPLWILESSGDSARFRDRIKKMVVTLYLELGLMMTLLDRVCME